MASETVDAIDWSHPLPSWRIPPERHVHSINQCNLSGTRTWNRAKIFRKFTLLCFSALVMNKLLKPLHFLFSYTLLNFMKGIGSNIRAYLITKFNNNYITVTMYPHSHPLAIGGTVLKESDDLFILGVTFDSKMTFEKPVRVRVTRGALVAHRYTYAPLRCKTSKYAGPVFPFLPLFTFQE